MTVPERVVIEADQDPPVPHAEGGAKSGMEMTVRAEMPEVPAEMKSVQVRLEVVRVAMAAMEEAVMTVATVPTVQEPVVTVATVPAPGQKNYTVRVSPTAIIESHRCRPETCFIGPRCFRRNDEQARQQHGRYRREEPHNSLLFSFIIIPGGKLAPHSAIANIYRSGNSKRPRFPDPSSRFFYRFFNRFNSCASNSAYPTNSSTDKWSGHRNSRETSARSV
jgi:hypothetical protein